MDSRTICEGVFIRAHYPNYALKEWEANGMQVKMTDGDPIDLKEGSVDFIGIS